MKPEIDVKTMDIDLYSDKSVKDFTAEIANKDGRLWLSNALCEIAAESASLAVKALSKTGGDDAEVQSTLKFAEVLRKFFLRTIDQELQSRAEWDKAVAENQPPENVEGAVYAACSEIDEVLYGMVKLLDMLAEIADKIAPAACADAAAAVAVGRSTMECVKLQRTYYSTFISGEISSRTMRREPEMAIEECTSRYDELYNTLHDRILLA